MLRWWGFPADRTSAMPASFDRRAFLRHATRAGAMVVTAGGLAGSIGPRVAQATGPAAPAGDSPYGALQPANSDGLMLPPGFTSRLIAVSGQQVAATGYVWHEQPDGAACMGRSNGGWYLVSNCEASGGLGGASVIRFNAQAEITGAYRILAGTSRSCSGGATPWGTYLSGEENDAGRVFECDPSTPGQGIHRPALGLFDHEMSVVDPLTGWVYMVEDDPKGRLYRFQPTRWGDLSAGALQVARVSRSANGDVLKWQAASPDGPDRTTTSPVVAGGEGMWIERGQMYFTTKTDVKVWRLELASQRLSIHYDFRATPSAPLNAVDNLTGHSRSGDLFVAEDGGNLEVCILPTSGPAAASGCLRFVGHHA